jgi:hypothetical protein
MMIGAGAIQSAGSLLHGCSSTLSMKASTARREIELRRAREPVQSGDQSARPSCR